MRRKLVESRSGLAVEWLEGGDIAFMEGLSVFSEHDIAVIRRGGSGNARARAPEQFFFLVGGAIGQFLVGAALDAKLAIRITR